MNLSDSGPPSSRSRSGLRRAVLLLVFVAPLPFGSVQPWAVLGLEICAGLLGLWALWILRREPLAPRPRWMLLPAAAIVAAGLVQLVPLPAAWVSRLVAPTAELRATVWGAVPEAAATLAPLSLEPQATLDALLRVLAYVMVGLAAAVSFKRREHLLEAAAVLAAAGAFQGFYGAAEYLSGRQHIFGYAKKFYLDEATGTFINRNHYAGFLAMCLGPALGLMLEVLRGRRPGGRTWRERVLLLGEPAGQQVVLGAAATALIWLGVVLSYSRAGLAVALAAVGFVVLRTIPTGKRRALVLVVLAAPTVFLLWQGVRMPGARFVEGQHQLADLHGRLPVYRATLEMSAAYLPLGSGLGTYRAAFRPFSPTTREIEWDHAHNDWLQALAEGGLPVAGALALLLFMALRRGPPPRRGATHLDACLTASIVAIALHSLVDFSLRIPAVAVLLAALLGAICWSSRPRAVAPPLPEAVDVS